MKEATVRAEVRFLPIGTHRRIKYTEPIYTTSALVVSAFVIAVLSTSVTLIVSSVADRPLGLPHWVDSDPNAYCLRASRDSNFATVALSVGTPPRIVRVLVRGDRVLHDTDVPSTTLFADELLRSESLRCGTGRVCQDVAFLTTGTGATQTTHSIQFSYGSAASGSYYTEQSVGAEGYMHLMNGTYYEFTNTHLCWTTSESTVAPSDWKHEVAIQVDNHTGATKVSSVGSIESLVSTCTRNGQIDEGVELWPFEATNERHWLALSSDFLYEASSSRLEERRSIVERGLGCVDNYTTGVDVYELDCTLDLYAECRRKPSLPFRRLSQMRIAIDLRSYDTPTLYAYEELSLTRLAGSSVSESVLFALTRLFVLLIVAFVVYSRSDRQSTSAYFAISNAINIANGGTHFGFHSMFNAVADAFIGALAFISRIIVLVVQSNVLVADGNGMVLVSEIVGISASVLHFICRNFVLRTDLSKESPLTKLGGSMAIGDASVAALVSVTVAPLLAASNRDFDAIARLLCGVLVVFFVLPRLWAGTTASALLASTTSRDGGFDTAYPVVLWFSSVLWATQGVSVGVAVARLFVLPQAYSLSRNVHGDGVNIIVLVALVTLSLAAPPMNSMNVKLKRDTR